MAAPLILLEDEDILRHELADFLGQTGWIVDAVANLQTFRACYAPAHHRIAVIDLGLPDGDGMDLVRELRASGNPLGIVVLTARSAVPDRVMGLVEGADHYLPKTADLDEIEATLAALSRRLESGFPAKPVWLLEQAPRHLTPPGHPPIPLSQQDYLVLHAVMARQGGLVSRRDIVTALGEDFFAYDQRRLDTQIRRLRRKVEVATGMALPLNTARNAGYCFFASVTIRA